MKPWLLKFHRWIALAFSLPLTVVLATGLLLSFEPWLVSRAIEPGLLSPAKVQTLLKQHDPDGKARSLVVRSYDKTLTISAGRGGGTVVNVGTGQALAGPSVLANTLLTARRLHETLLLDAGWLVIGSTGAMVVLALLGALMGLPRFANSLSGWHKAMAWGLLPLIVLSPLTGLFLAYGITVAGPSPAAAGAQGAPLTLTEAVQILGKDHDLSSLVWIRPQGGRVLARIVEGNEYVVYAVARDGVASTPRNWPRLWHEGNFAGIWSALMNVVTSVTMIGLLVTGLWIWLRRRIRMRSRRLAKVALA
jgi:uncharacterized iron-regulated membrane protein